MGLTIANNVASLNAQNNLNRANQRLTTSVERLSSGLKVNRGADGPAALVISEKQRAQIAGLKQAIENSEKAVSLVQTAEGALGEINALLVKVRSLAIDSANTGINDEDALAANQAEIANALDTINRIANNTQFLTKKLLDGSSGISGTASSADVSVLGVSNDTVAGAYDVVVTTAGERATVNNGGTQTGALTAAETLTVNGVAISLEVGFTQADVIDRINEFTAQTGVVAEDVTGTTRLYSTEFGSGATIQVVSDTAAGATTSGFGNVTLNDTGVDIAGTIGGVAATGSGITLTASTGDPSGISITVAADAGDATSTYTGALGNISVTDNSLQFQIGPNAYQTANVSINRVNPGSLGVGVADNQFNNLDEIDVTTANGAQDAISVIDAAIDDITTLRGDLGAFQQNTLSSTANNLRTTLENTVNAESVIRDTDFAEEIANFTQQQVLVQAGTSVLGNANQLPQLVLSLLG
ncbi:MAG: hypothetical protein KDA80_04795 [Planctomycetaceae bacterium]|nr:hypothetical protein [Planctomycetaceae bacterium]